MARKGSAGPAMDVPSGAATGAIPGFVGMARTEITTEAELISFETHLNDCLRIARPLDPIELPLTDALGHVLAAEVLANEALPAFANSAMDGYALQAADVASAAQDSPSALKVVGEVAAGNRDLPRVEAGNAVRIMTGAPVPPGADTIVPVEVTSEDQGVLQVYRPSKPGEFVRTVGQDVRPGDVLLKVGRIVRPADLGLMAAIGHTRVVCRPAPRVVIVSTGDELVPAIEAPPVGKIRNSNGPMLAAMVRQLGGHPFNVGPVADDRASLMQAIDSSSGHADLFITTGGVSAGAHDHVRDAVGALGEVASRKVAMKPGMPQVLGLVRGIPVLGLPGNPVSAFVSFEVFARPVIRRLQGRRDLFRASITASLTTPVKSPKFKRSFIRVKIEKGERGWLATPTGEQGSHLIRSIVDATGLAEIPEDQTELAAGKKVTVRLLVDPS